MLQRLAAVATLVTALLVVLVASAAAPASHGARSSGHTPEGGFSRHPQVAETDRALLSRAGGTLWWVDGRCNVEGMNLATQHLLQIEGTFCHFWPNPQGTLALATIGGAPGEMTLISAERRLAVVDLRPGPRGLRQIATIHHQDGVLASTAVWNAAGTEAMFCIVTPAGPEVTVTQAGSWDQTELPHACHPAYLPGGQAVVVRGDKVIRTRPAFGRSVVPLDDMLAKITRGRPARITALGGNATGDPFVAMGVARAAQYGRPVAPIAIAVTDLAGRGINTRPGDVGVLHEVGVAPDGRGAWYEGPDGLSHLGPGVRLRPPPPPVPETALRYAWNAPGTYLAVAEEGQIRLFDWRTGLSATIGNVTARDLAYVQ